MGTSIRAVEGILRRSTAMGLGGLAIALFVGVMSFAVTTKPAGQSQESVSRYLAMPDRVLDLSVISSGATGLTDLTGRTAALIGPRAEAPPAGSPSRAAPAPLVAVAASGSDPAGEAPPPARSANARPLEASFAPILGPTPGIPVARALGAERTPVAPQAAEMAIAAAAIPPAEAAGPLEPVLTPGERVTATVSFYYCEVGEQGHPGDGGNFCGVMRDGSVVYPGAAACAYAYLGQRFRIVGDPTERVYQCADTGSAVHGLHRDIWFMSSDEGWAWQAQVGQVAELEIVD